MDSLLKVRIELISLFAAETCCSEDTSKFINTISSALDNDVQIKSVKMGDTLDEDYKNSYRMHPFKQV